jgi:parallel beta helix pectate lyase-like protein
MHRILMRAVAACAALALCSIAHAQVFRTYLSSNGADGNPCSLKLPCRLLPAALAAVADGGEVWMLDSANYNGSTVDIAKSVSIVGIPGVSASFIAVDGPALTISTPGVNVAFQNVVIRGMPGGTGTHGIFMTNGDSLTVRESLIANLPAQGIQVFAAARVNVMDTVVRDNGGAGIALRGAVLAQISNVKALRNNGSGILVQGGVSATAKAAIDDCVLSGNTSFGLLVDATASGSNAIVTATRVTSSHNEWGFFCQGINPATCTVGFSVATHNRTAGFAQTGLATFRSLGNNIVTDNGTNVQGTLTPLAGT